ncbi:MAG: SDR family oxidoreductase [Clostridiales Family XIII bacterium]|jgi:NAD(P)-dependent dehydrogenase (short-subunit alcohol dehydrogenase family)|nr:SDR family oxidoreductase [Clostridiales Family XIII bacterium]
MDGRLNGKVALITGGGAGLGAAFTKRFVAEGARVLISGRRREVLETLAASLPAGSVAVYPGDVANPEDAKGMVEAAVKFGGKLDTLINNAGIDPPGAVADLPVEQWQRILGTNLTGAFYTMKFAIPHMIANGGGSIINISSLAALRCIPSMPAYIASKAGLIGLSQSAALDYGAKNIRCNVICPGATRTEMLEIAMEPLAKAQGTDVAGALNLMTRFCPFPRAAHPDEIAGTAVYLASEDASFVTGAVLPVDGGACVVDPNGAALSSGGVSWGE